MRTAPIGAGHRRGGGTLMIAATGSFTVNDALCKWVMPNFPIGQIMAIRGVVILLLVSGVVVVSPWFRAQLVFNSPKLHAIRAISLALSAALFMGGLAYMPLMNAVVLSFTTPVFVVLLARPLLKEHVPAKYWVAVVAGFIGMLVILQPSIQDFGWASILPACAAMVTAASDLITRRMVADESSLSLAVSGATGPFLLGLCTIAFGWRWSDPTSLAIMGFAGVFVFLSYYFVAEAFQHGPASYVSPFRYSALVWGSVIAFFVWGQTPELNVLIGSAVLIGAGVYLAKASDATSSELTNRP